MVYSDSDILGYRLDAEHHDAVYDELAFNQTSKLGVQFNYRINPKFDVVGQFLYRGEHTDTFDKLTKIAFIRYQLTNNWSVRFGRTPLDVFLLTKFRDIDSAIPWANVPKDVYSMHPTRSVDGVDVIYSRLFDDVELRAKFYWGHSEFTLNNVQLSDDEIQLDSLRGLSLELSAVDWLVSLKYSDSDFKDAESVFGDWSNLILALSPIWPDAHQFVEDLSFDNYKFDYFALGGRFDFDKFSVYSELTRISGTSSFVRQLDSGYISAVYNQGDFDYFIGFGKTHGDSYNLVLEEELNIPPSSYPPEIPFVFDLLNTTMNIFAPKQETIFVGFSWYLNDNWSFKMQLDVTDVEEGGGTLWTQKSFGRLQTDEQVNTLFMNLSFNF